MEDIIRVENLSYSYDGKPAVDRISFSIKRGEILGFLGPNGAGKTTTLKLLSGLLPLQEGKIFMLGIDISRNRKECQAKIGVTFEEKNLYEDMTAEENLKFFAALFGKRKLDPRPLLERVGLKPGNKNRVQTYSKGMKQRLMIARALVNDPEILLLDEPTDGLDPISARAIREVILTEKRRGVSVFLTTHDMMEADILSDRVAFINEGRIVALDTPDNLKHKYGKRIVKVRYFKEGELTEEDLSLEEKETPRRIESIMRTYGVFDMHTEEATLEDIFIRFTGRRLEG